MPRKVAKRYKKKNKKRNYKKRKSGTVAMRANGRLNVLPQSILVKMRYVEQIDINPAAGVPASAIFSASSIYDPNPTGTGHQPMGHDQWLNFYNRYIVIGSKCTARAVAQGTVVDTNAAVLSIGLQTTASTTIAAISDLMERRSAKYAILGASDGSRSVTTVTNHYSTKKFWGIRAPDNSADSYSAQLGASPTIEAFYHIALSPITSTSNTVGTTVWVTIDYIVRLSSPVNLTQS